MDRETTLRLLNRFVDHNRKSMSKPFSENLSIGKYLCATNGRIVVLIPETLENQFEKDKEQNPPSIDRIFPDLIDEIQVEFSDIFQLFNDTPIIERYITEVCESCDGAGEFTHCGYNYDCKECDETGEVQTLIKEKVKKPSTLFKFHQTFIDIKDIASLVDVYNASQPKLFSIIKLNKAILWFKLDDTYIGIASMNNNDEKLKRWEIKEVTLRIIKNQ